VSSCSNFGQTRAFLTFTMTLQVFVRTLCRCSRYWQKQLANPGDHLGSTTHSGQRYIIYPAYAPSGSRQNVDTPDKHKMPIYEDLTLESPDKLKIKAYLMLQGAGLAGKAGEDEAKKRPTVLFLHANAGNMVSRSHCCWSVKTLNVYSCRDIVYLSRISSMRN
jgi:hypothetical protein